MPNNFRHSFLATFWSHSSTKLSPPDDKKPPPSSPSIRRRTKCMKVGSRYSLPVGLSSVTLKSYSSNIEMDDPNAKTRPWYILWKGRTFIPPKKDKEPSPPSKKASTTSLTKKKTLERQKSKKEETDKAENEDGKTSIKRKDTFRRRFSLRMRKTALKHTLSSATTSTATSSEYQSDEGGESEDYSDDDDDDEDTLVNSIKLSSQTLSLGGADDHFSDRDGSANRLTELFINDINLVVEKTLALPNGPDKIKMIHSVLESIRPLYNMATLNLHFVILSSHVTEEPNSAQDLSKVN